MPIYTRRSGLIYNYYRILDVPITANFDEIKKAYDRKVRELDREQKFTEDILNSRGFYQKNPDYNKIMNDAYSQLLDITYERNKIKEALGVLENKETRQQHDNEILLEDCYKCLAISPTATDDDITQASQRVQEQIKKSGKSLFYGQTIEDIQNIEHVLLNKDSRKNYDKLLTQTKSLDKFENIRNYQDVISAAKKMSGNYTDNIRTIFDNPYAQQALSNIPQKMDREEYFKDVVAHLSVQQTQIFFKKNPSLNTIENIYRTLPYLRDDQLYAFCESTTLLHDEETFYNFMDKIKTGGYRQHTLNPISYDQAKILENWSELHRNASDVKLKVVTSNSYSANQTENIQKFNEFKTKLNNNISENRSYTKEDIIKSLESYKNIRVNESFSNNSFLEYARDTFSTTGSANNKLSLVNDLVNEYSKPGNKKSFETLVNEHPNKETALDGRLGELIKGIIKNEQGVNQKEQDVSKINENTQEAIYTGPK